MDQVDYVSGQLGFGLPYTIKSKPNNAALEGELADAFDASKGLPMLPMGQGHQCQARQVLDMAAANVLNMTTKHIVELQSMLGAEPTVTNKPAPSGRF